MEEWFLQPNSHLYRDMAGPWEQYDFVARHIETLRDTYEYSPALRVSESCFPWLYELL